MCSRARARPCRPGRWTRSYVTTRPGCTALPTPDKTRAAPRKRASPRGGSPVDSVQHSALRKTAWRLVPLLTVAYVFNYLDRTCIGFAALTMNRDIGLTAAQFGLGAGIFFIG